MDPSQNPQNLEDPPNSSHKSLVLQPIGPVASEKAIIPVAPAVQLRQQALQELSNPINNALLPSIESQEPLTLGKTPLWLKLATVVVLSLFPPVVLAFSQLPFIAALAILFVPVFIAGNKRIEGVFLPYALSAGINIFAYRLIKALQGADEKNTRDFMPLLAHHSNQEFMIMAAAIGVALAIIAFVVSNYGFKAARIAANFILRFAAVWLVLYSGAAAYDVVGKYQLKAEDRSYMQSVDYYNKATLDSNVPVINAGAPDGYSFRTVNLREDGPVYKEYELYFTPSSTSFSDISVHLSSGSIPAYCDNTSAPRIQTNDSGDIFTCDIVTKDTNGQPIYGYRELNDLRYQGYDPMKLTPAELKRVPPGSFYMIHGNALVELAYGKPTDYTSNPLNEQIVKRFADSIRTASPSERQAFIDENIKPSKPFNIQRIGDENSSGAKMDIVIALYATIFLWAIEKLFIKARKPYWQAYVPVMNLWVLTTIAGRPGWWSLLAYLDTNPYSSSNLNFLMTYIVFAPILIPLMIALTLVRLILFVLVSTSIAEKFGKPKLFSLLLIIPPFLGYLILGFDSSKYEADTATLLNNS